MGNIFKSFRDLYEIETTNSLQKRYDEPTYLTFKLMFTPSPEFNDVETTNYDRMPHPLFESAQSDDFNARTKYSSINYLRDSNEFTRAKLLEEFIQKMIDLQFSYQWYFQKVDGIGDLLTINTKRGKRVPEDFRLSITTLEGLDLRMSYLLNLYRKIVWDDEYQRWVLPDMMRYFKLRIFISEYRTFHVASNQFSSNAIIPTNSRYGQSRNFLQSIGDTVSQPIKDFARALLPSQLKFLTNEYVILNALENIMPTWVIECEQCEFDIEHMPFSYLGNLSNTDDPTMAFVEFKIKVGKVNEMQAYPLFRYAYLSDKLLNNLPARTREEKPAESEPAPTTTGVVGILKKAAQGNIPFNSVEAANNRNLQNIVALNIALDYDDGIPDSHVSGTPFNQGNGYENLKNSGPNAAIDYNSIDPTNPNTWVGNAITFGKAYTTNLIEDTIEKMTMSPIRNLGFSLNDATAALESKDFNQVFALIRRYIEETTKGDLSPSNRLNEPIVDNTFRQFLNNLTKSEATDGDNLELVQAANLVLNDKGLWEQIKDYSLATDLVSKGEININNIIEGSNEYKNIMLEQSDNDRSKATDLDGGPKIIQPIIFESSPSSTATNKKINMDKNIQQSDTLSEATNSNNLI